jgi:hypothetical protein
MLKNRFYISWISSSLIMFLFFYAWHGLYLNDFSHIGYHIGVFLTMSAFVYLLIGFILAKAIHIEFLNVYFKGKPVIKGVVSGIVCGICLFLIANVFGVSFNTNTQIANLVLDFCWQIFEQSIGGAIVGIVHFLIFDPAVMFGD